VSVSKMAQAAKSKGSLRVRNNSRLGLYTVPLPGLSGDAAPLRQRTPAARVGRGICAGPSTSAKEGIRVNHTAHVVERARFSLLTNYLNRLPTTLSRRSFQGT
jgi:hypothetical protein